MAKLVSYAEENGKSLGDLSLADYHRFSPLFAEDVHSITIETSMAAKDIAGGTAQKQVGQALATAKKLIGRSFS